MRVFHNHDDATTPDVSVPPSLQRLQEALEALGAREPGAEGFESFEREVHGLFVQAEREVLAEALERLDMDVPEVVMDGCRYRRVLRASETYTSAVGPVTVTRTLYRAGRSRAVVPLERRAGIVAGHWTPLAARQASFLVAQLTPGECEATLRELGNMTPSKSSLDRLPKALGGRWEADREAHETVLREDLEVPEAAVSMAVSLDGVMVPMADGARAAKRAEAQAAGRRTKGPAGYQEVGCGSVSFYDAAGERLYTIRFARMPETKKATLKSMLAAEVETALARRPELTVVKVADGAPDNWTFLNTLMPEGEERVDFFHAVEQLKAALDAAYGENDPKGRAQFEKLRHHLRHDPRGAEKVIRALVHLRAKHPQRKRIREVLGYFRRHRRRMNYADAAARNLPIGSGVIEATCKSLATQRLKRSGMRWRHPGGQAILTLRGWLQSNRFEQAWHRLSETYQTEVGLPDNGIPPSGKQAA